MSRWFMLHGGKHHQLDEGLYLHYRDTCNVLDAAEISTGRSPWAPRSTSMDEMRQAASRLGWVTLCYEKKGVMTFFVQLSPTRAAWQRIEWPTGFDGSWDDVKVQEAIDNFLWVAECEEAGQLLPRP